MFKFELGTKVWYLYESIPCCQPIFGRYLVEYSNVPKERRPNLGGAAEIYQTVHGNFHAKDLFATQQELAKWVADYTISEQ